MSPTVDDLRGALRDAAERPASPSYAAGRLDGVRLTVRRRAQRRAALAAGAAALVVLGGVGVVRGVPTSLRAPAPQPAASTASTLAPTYFQGGRLAGVMEAAAEPGTTRSFTVTPTTWNLSISHFCTPAAERAVSVEVSVNGRLTLGGSCGGGTGRAGWNLDEQYWRGAGVQLGKPSLTVTLKLTAADPATDHGTGPTPTGPATVAVGVYQDVPVESYPFPTPPAVRTSPAPNQYPLSLDRRLPVTITTATGQPAANGTWSEKVAWSPRLSLHAVVWTPGRFAVAVNGVEVGGLRHWTYDAMQTDVNLDADTLGQYGVPLPEDGQQVTVSLTFSGFAEPAWEATLGERPSR